MSAFARGFWLSMTPITITVGVNLSARYGSMNTTGEFFGFLLGNVLILFGLKAMISILSGDLDD